MRVDLWPDESREDLAAGIMEFFAGRSSMPSGVLVAESDPGRLLGFAELSIRRYAEGCTTDHVAFLEGWYVVPDARQTGVGRALMRASEVWGRAQGSTEFASDALLDNSISAAAHKALGFSEVVLIRCFRKDL